VPDGPADIHAKRDLLAGPLLRTLLRLGIPLAVGWSLQSFYMIVDAFWLGKWSKTALAAPGVSGMFMMITLAVNMGLGTAATALISQYAGARRHRRADHAAAQALLLLCGVTLLLAVPILVFREPLFRLVQVPASVRPKASLYLYIQMLGAPAMAFTMGCYAALRALGDTISVVVLGVVSNAVNLVLDPFLIFGWAGLPALGVGGAALASLTARLLMALACYGLVRRHRAGLQVRLADLRPDAAMLRRLVAVGSPAAAAQVNNALALVLFRVMVNVLGVAVIGATTIGFRVVRLFLVPSNALAAAAGPVVGQALGAGRPAVARRAVWVSVALAAALLFAPFALLVWQGPWVARAFTPDPDVIRETTRFFRVVPASAFLFGVFAVLTAAFYGSGRTRYVMLLSVVRLWCVRLPVAYVLAFVAGWGSLGIYGGMVAGNIAAGLTAYWFFRRARWQVPVIETAPEKIVTPVE